MARFTDWLRGLFGKKEGGSVARPSARHMPARSIKLWSFAGDNNDFALAMYGQLRQGTVNLFFSPFSIRTALSMTQAGARGETAEQMRQTLRVSSSDKSLHAAFTEIIQRLNTFGAGTYELSVANSLWCQDGAPLQPEFLNVVARDHGGAVNAVDFSRGAEAARVRINDWVANETRQRIQGPIPAGGFDALTRLVLVNAIYFKGTWTNQFCRSETRDEPFRVEDGGTVQAPLMYQREWVRYLKAEGYQAVDLPYQGDDLSMLVLLPDRKDGLQDLEKIISARMLYDCLAQMDTCEVELFLPRFKLTWRSVSLSAKLAALGMPLAFTRSQADFSGINGREPPHEESLFLSDVFHSAFVDTNEEGTEAAAATDMAMTLGLSFSPPPVAVFRADHPFLFAIRDQMSGAILFLGRIADPTRERSY